MLLSLSEWPGLPSDGRHPAQPREELAEVEARITGELARLIAPGRLARCTPPAYVRRHLVEHAAAGGVLDERVLTVGFLPFVDAGRLRALTAVGAVAGEAEPLLRVWRRAAHAWRWDSPAGNASALSVWACVHQTPVAPAGIRGVWEPCWGRWQTDAGEILGRVTGTVFAVAALVLPDGRPIAVTGSGDGTVRVWDLDTGQPVGGPLTSDTENVLAVAALVLPDGRPVAVTGSDDGTVRVWDLAHGCTTAYPVLHVPGGVSALAVNRSGDRLVVVVAGAGLIAMLLPAEEP